MKMKSGTILLTLIILLCASCNSPKNQNEINEEAETPQFDYSQYLLIHFRINNEYEIFLKENDLEERIEMCQIEQLFKYAKKKNPNRKFMVEITSGTETRMGFISCIKEQMINEEIYDLTYSNFVNYPGIPEEGGLQVKLFPREIDSLNHLIDTIWINQNDQILMNNKKLNHDQFDSKLDKIQLDTNHYKIVFLTANATSYDFYLETKQKLEDRLISEQSKYKKYIHEPCCYNDENYSRK